MKIFLSIISIFHFTTIDVKSSKINYDASMETATITFPSTIPTGNAQLSMNFVGELNDKMKGFYRSKYKDANGEDRYCAVTQFEVSAFAQFFQNFPMFYSRATFEIGLNQTLPSQSICPEFSRLCA